MILPINYGAANLTETYGSQSVSFTASPTEADPRRFSGRVEVGMVHQVIHGTYLYRVVFEGYRSPLQCTALSPYSVLQSAVSQSYPVGTQVIVLVNEDFTWGVILGPVPPAYEQSTKDSIAAANFVSGVGSFHYGLSNYLRHFLDNAPLAIGLCDFAARRTKDNLPGDYTISNILGGGFHTDPFQTFLRQSHSCGIWAFAVDQLLRLMGQSIQEYSIVHERYAGVDEAESYLFEGIALYPWEALGLLMSSGDLYEKNDAAKILNEKGIGFMEPVDKRAEPFYRLQTFSGFLGQGRVQYFFVPPKTKKLEDHPIAVSRQQSLLDGTLLFESAKGIHLVKHGNITSFKRVRPIEDPQGDDLRKGNYQFSKTPAPKPLPADASITDQILYALWKQAETTFEEHKHDFEKIPREQLPFVERDVIVAPVQSLKTKAKMPDPPTQPIFVDERYGNVAYSGTRSSISLLPDGGIAIRGGCGEEILLQGGNITLSAPGDLRCLLGRSAVTLAGDDIVLRAKNSVDMTATDHDVRIKAEKNLDMVGGMSGSGRTLLENKAKTLPTIEGLQSKEGEDISSAGITIRAADSVLASYGRRIYTRSVKNGEIFIDADDGNGSIKARARYIGLLGYSNLVVGVGYTGDNDLPANFLQMSRGSTLFTKRLEVDAQIISSKRVLADLGCNQNELDPPSFDEERLEGIKSAQEHFYESNIEQPNENYYDEQGLGSEEMISANTFSYRNSDQCGANRFDFEEPFWMELYGQPIVASLAAWKEPVYAYQEAIEQTAWPGHEKWVKDKCVQPNKTTLYNAVTGNDEPAANTQTEKLTPEEFFRIIDPQ